MSKERTILKLTAIFLSSGRYIDALSSFGFIVTFVLIVLLKELILYHAVLLFLILLTGTLQKVYALRVNIDEKIFYYLANVNRDDGVFDEGVELKELDIALSAIGVKEIPASTRSLKDRIAGAKRLLILQITFCILEYLFLISLLLSGIPWIST